MLNMKKLLTKILTTPLIVQSGTSGIWTYRKWSDGTAECWGTTSKSITGVSKGMVWGTAYCYAFGGINFPTDMFNAVPTAVVNTRLESQYNTATYANVYQTNVSVEIASSATGTRTAYAYIYAIGKWK